MTIGVLIKNGANLIGKNVFAGDEIQSLSAINLFATGHPTLTVEIHRDTDADWATAFDQVIVPPQALTAPEVTTLHTNGVSTLSAKTDTGILMRAFADIVKDEINILRALHALAPRTLAQLRTSLETRINSGSVDS